MKHMKINSFMQCCFVGLLGLFLAGCSSKQKKDNELVLGTCSGFPPYETINEQGDIVGFDIDVAQKIAKKLNKTLVIKDMSFDSLLISLQQGKIDIILAGLSITQARLAAIAMVHYHGEPLTSLPILFWNNIPEGISSVADLAQQTNKTVCVQVGTIQEEIISTYPYLTIKHMENIPDLILDIKHGKSIAAVVEPKVVAALQQQVPEIKTLDLPLKQHEQDMGHGVGINKNNKQLIESIKTIIDQLQQDGTIKSLEQQWFIGGNHAHQ